MVGELIVWAGAYSVIIGHEFVIQWVISQVG
jgi:hypothetical protein